MALSLRNRLLVSIAVISMFFGTGSGEGYMIGDSMWYEPPWPDFYSEWSASHVFNVSDEIVFGFDSGQYDLIQVPQSDYDNCVAENPIQKYYESPVNIVLKEGGVLYFICDVGEYCSHGLKVSITVNAPPSPPPSPPPPPPPPPPALPAGPPVEHTIGWTVPTLQDAYATWSSSEVFYTGDTLVLHFNSQINNVLQVPQSGYDGCTDESYMRNYKFNPANIMLSEPGVFYYISFKTDAQACQAGLKISVHVLARPPPPPPPPPPVPSPPPPVPSLPPFLSPEPSASINQGNTFESPPSSSTESQVPAPSTSSTSCGTTSSTGLISLFAFCLFMFL